MAETPFDTQPEPATHSTQSSAKPKKRKIPMHAWHPSSPEWENDDDDPPYVDLDTGEYVGTRPPTWDVWSQTGTPETHNHHNYTETNPNTNTVLADTAAEPKIHTEQMVKYHRDFCSCHEEFSDESINGLKTISKRLVKKNPATGRREIKILWSMDLDLEYEDSDDGAGSLSSWVQRVDSDWDGKEYDEDYERQERWRKRQRQRIRIQRAVGTEDGEEPLEYDPDVSWMDYSDGDDSEEGKGRANGHFEIEEEKEETAWTKEMAHGVGHAAPCWYPVTVATTSRIMLIKGSDRKLVEIIDMDVMKGF